MKQSDFADTDFKKSTICLPNPSPSCVEVAIKNGLVGVRDSKNPAAAVLTFSPDEWQAFTAGVKKGEFDV